MYFDVQTAIELVGEKAINDASATALKEKNITFTFNAYTESQSKISYCLKNFYQNNTGKRKKRSFVLPNTHNEGLIDGDALYLDETEANTAPVDNNFVNSRTPQGLDNELMKPLNQLASRKLLSLDNNTSFKDIENEVLSNDIVSKALGTDVCRYCMAECPAN